MRIDTKALRALSACDGKLKHRSRLDAEKNAQSVRYRKGAPVRAYLCPICDYWHVGGR